MARSPFQEQLAKQLRYLENSCRLYDSGETDEATRMATSMRVMFHNTAKSISLLVHMAASVVEMFSTAGRRVLNNPDGYWPALIQIEFSLEPFYLKARPKFRATPRAHRFIPFRAWWDETVFVSGQRRFTRSKIILDAANKDGGAHVDAALPADYRWMVEGAAFSIARQPVDGSEERLDLSNPHLACLRQMAFEVLNSPALLNLADYYPALEPAG